jgi:hypothetical protein
LSELEKRDVEVVDIAEEVMENPAQTKELLACVFSTKPRVKFGSAKILRIISERNPKLLYSEIDFFVHLLDTDNAILRWTALDIIANLTTVDSNNKFDNMLFRKFCSFLQEGNLITAAHVVDNLGKIAQVKPEFQEEVTRKLLHVEEISLPTKECRNILVGKIINAFSIYYDQINDKHKVISFVKRHLNNRRKATSVKAEKFLKKLEKH